MNKKTLSLLSIATSGLILAGSAHAAEKGTTVAKVAKTKFKCEHSTDCKGHGACKTEANACKGQNSCKGSGYTMVKDEAACKTAQAKVAPAPAAAAETTKAE